MRRLSRLVPLPAGYVGQRVLSTHARTVPNVKDLTGTINGVPVTREALPLSDEQLKWWLKIDNALPGSLHWEMKEMFIKAGILKSNPGKRPGAGSRRAANGGKKKVDDGQEEDDFLYEREEMDPELITSPTHWGDAQMKNFGLQTPVIPERLPSTSLSNWINLEDLARSPTLPLATQAFCESMISSSAFDANNAVQFLSRAENLEPDPNSPSQCFLTALARCCRDPKATALDYMNLTLLFGLGFASAPFALNPRTPLTVNLSWTALSAEYDLVVTKRDNTQQSGEEVVAVMVGDKRAGEGVRKRKRGSGQLFAQSLVAAMYNYADNRARDTRQDLVVPMIYSQGVTKQRLVLAQYPYRYLDGAHAGNLRGISERPMFRVWPSKPLSLIRHEDRCQWINGLLVLRQNLLAPKPV